MKILIISIIIFITTAAWAEDQKVEFSAYDPSLKLISYDSSRSAAEFEGQISLDGVLYFIFDSDVNFKSADINFARFVPSEQSKALLPSVVRGFYPGEIEYISLEPADLALISVYGTEEADRLKHGGDLTKSVSVRIVLYKFTSSIECDARSYWSTSFSIKPIQNKEHIVIKVPSGGC